MRLANKLAIVTAAASGMGRAGVELFLKEGARVAAIDVNADALADMAACLGREGHSIETVRADLSKPDEMRPEEAAHAALWLAFDDASYVTGVALPVDGGFTAR